MVEFDPGASDRSYGMSGAASEAIAEVDLRKTYEASLRDTEARQVFLLDLADELRTLTNATDIAALASARLGAWLDANRAFYAELAGTQLIVERDYTHDVPTLVGEHSLASFGPDMLAAYRASTIIVVNDVEAEARFGARATAGLLSRQVAAYIDVILFQDDQWVSLLAVQSATPRT